MTVEEALALVAGLGLKKTWRTGANGALEVLVVRLNADGTPTTMQEVHNFGDDTLAEPAPAPAPMPPEERAATIAFLEAEVATYDPAKQAGFVADVTARIDELKSEGAAA